MFKAVGKQVSFIWLSLHIAYLSSICRSSVGLGKLDDVGTGCISVVKFINQNTLIG